MEDVRVPGKDGKMITVFQKNPDKTLVMKDGEPVPLKRPKITTYIPCVGKDGVRYRVSENVGFKKAMGAFMRVTPDYLKVFWRIASLTSKAKEADVMVIEKVP
jgi:hypothetical protein